MATPERIREIVESATVDAYGEDEQAMGWEVTFQDAVRFPFKANALGKPVQVVGLEVDPHRGVRCEIEGSGIARRQVSLDTLDKGTLPETLQEVWEAWEAWQGGGY
jgi:hypothetical protein